MRVPQHLFLLHSIVVIQVYEPANVMQIEKFVKAALEAQDK